MASPPETPVFANSNLGTHMAMSISPDITVGDLKSKLGMEHSICFPNLGEIKVHALMVKRKSYFYHLPDDMPIKVAFQGLAGSWFLCMGAHHVDCMDGKTASMPCMKESCKGHGAIGKNTQVLDTSSASEKLTSSNHLQQCHDKGQVIGLQAALFSHVEDSMPDVSNVTDHTTKSGHHVVTENINMKNTACKSGRVQYCVSSKEKLIPFTHAISERRWGLVLGHDPSEARLEGASKKIKTGNSVATNEMCLLETVTSFDTEKEKQMKCRSLDLDWRKKIYSLEKKSNTGCVFDEAPSESLSEKISVSGIISRYFQEFDEVDSCASQAQITVGIKEFSKQIKGVHGCGGTQQGDLVDCATEAVELSTNLESCKETCQSGPSEVYAFDVASTVKKFKHKVRDKDRKKHKNNGTATCVTPVTQVADLDKEKAGGCVVSGELRDFERNPGESSQGKTKRYREIVRGAPHFSDNSISNMFSLPSPFGGHPGTARSKFARNEIGKRFQRAVSEFRLSSRKKKLPISILTSIGGKLPISHSSSLFRNILFEFDDDGD